MPARATTNPPIRWSRNRGRNDWDIPTEIAEDMSAESLNVRLEKGTLGVKRRGSAAQVFTGDTFAGAYGLFRFVPKEERFVTYRLPTRGTYTREFFFPADGRICSPASPLPAAPDVLEGGMDTIVCLDPGK